MTTYQILLGAAVLAVSAAVAWAASGVGAGGSETGHRWYLNASFGPGYVSIETPAAELTVVAPPFR